MATTMLTGFRVHPAVFSREYEFPTPLEIGIRIIPRQGMRQLDATEAVGPNLLMDRRNAPEMLLQWPNDGLRQHCDTIFTALSLAKGYFTTFKVRIFDAQMYRFEPSQATVVPSHRNEPLVAAAVGHDAREFVDREDDGQPFGATGTNHAFDAVERLFQNMLVAEQNGVQSLELCRGRNAFFDGQVSPEAVDIALRRMPGLLVFVELDGPANPVELAAR